MPFSPTFGAVGDFISVSILITDVIRALNGSRGSATNYQDLISELCVFNGALCEAAKIFEQLPSTPEFEDLRATGKRTAQECRKDVVEFIDNNRKKYDAALGSGASVGSIKGAVSKIRWSFKKDAVDKVKSEVMHHTQTVTMLLITANMKLSSLHNDKVTVHLDEVDNRTTTLIAAIIDHIQPLKETGSKLVRLTANIMRVCLRIHTDVASIRALLTPTLERPVSEEFFTLIDAVGREAPVHLRFIDSWDAFQGVLSARFQNREGARRVARRSYRLRERSMSHDIKISSDWSRSFLPGQVVIMSILCKTKPTWSRKTCPRCNIPLGDTADRNIECISCSARFDRVIEELSDEEMGSSSNVPSVSSLHRDRKRKRPAPSQDSCTADDTSSDEDATPFKMIRLIRSNNFPERTRSSPEKDMEVTWEKYLLLEDAIRATFSR